MKRKLRKLINKSAKIPCQICKELNILVQHHIEGRKIPNFNHFSNIVNICSNCHTEVHHDKIIIEGWFMTTDGMELLWHIKEEKSLTGLDKKCHKIN